MPTLFAGNPLVLVLLTTVITYFCGCFNGAIILSIRQKGDKEE